MAASQRSVLQEGVIAGVIGAVLVIAWFFAFDIARGQPLLTPTLLGTAVFHGVNASVGAGPVLGLIVGYTIIHFVAFILFGIVAASLISVSEREPPVFISFVILFVAFEVFFVGLVGAFSRSLLGELAWWSVLIANLLASVGMLWYFFDRHRALPRTLIGEWGGVLAEGAIAGVIGAVVVAVWFFVIDAIHGEPLRTPLLLGGGLLGETSTVGVVILYSLLHGAAFIGFGIVASFLVAAAEKQPLFVFALVILFTAFEVAFFGAIVIAASWVLDELAGWAIMAGNILAAAAMLAFFVRRHRELAQRLAHAWEEEEE
jgi:hypothetical protein